MSYVEEVDGEAVSWHFEQDRLFSKQRVEIIALTTKSSMRVNFQKKSGMRVMCRKIINPKILVKNRTTELHVHDR